MKKILGLVFLGFLALSACGIEPRDDGKTAVKVMLNGELEERTQEGLATSAQEVKGPQFALLVKVTAPDISYSLNYLNPHYEPGATWEILVPNGKERTFDFLMYYIYGVDYGSLWASLFQVDLLSSSTVDRTFDLLGTPITISLELTDWQAGTGGIEGLLQMTRTSGGEPYYTSLPICSYSVEAYLLDSEFGTLELPVIIDMSSAPSPGYYSITNVPRQRSYQLLIEREAMAWRGTSNSFVLDSATASVNVDLTGWQNMSLSPDKFLVKDENSGEGSLLAGTLRILGGWGAYNIWSELSNLEVTYFDQYGNTIDYYRGSSSPYGSDTVDTIYVVNCDGSDTVTSQAYWFPAPYISSVSPGESWNPINTYYGSQTVYVYGSNFDPPATVKLYLDGDERTVGGGGPNDLYFVAPSKPDGSYELRVVNPRTTPEFPSFRGWYDTYTVWYSTTSMPW